MKSNIIFVILLLQFITVLSCVDQKSDQKQQVNKVEQPEDINRPSASIDQGSEATLETKPEEKVISIPDEQLEKAREIIAGVSEVEISKIDAKQKYRSFCATCHGFKGDMSYNGTKELISSTYNLEENAAVIYFGRGTMTPYKTLLKPVEIVALAKYVDEEINK